MAVRETAKVFGLTDAEIGKVTERLPWFWRIKSASADLLADLKRRPETKALDFLRPWPDIMALAQQLIGTPHYLTVCPRHKNHPQDEIIPDPKSPLYAKSKDSF